MTDSISELAKPAAARAVSPVWGVVIALVLASLVKLAWALNSAGSVDAVLFYNFARAIEKFGLCGVYPIEVKFNHTPLTGMFALSLYRLAGGDFLSFSFLLRLASIIADVAVVAGLLRWREKLSFRVPWWALTLFAASPVSIMVSGFHGNVDPVMVALLFFAAVAVTFDRPVLCGLLFGLACNVKIVPIPFAPVFFFFWWARGGAWRFTAASGAMLLAGSAWPLWVCPREYLHNVFGYGSTWGVWGFTHLLRITGWSQVQTIGFHDLSPLQDGVASGLKLAAVGGILAVGWLRRRVASEAFPATLAGAWVVFFVFAPGVGVQYMVWFAPFLLLLAARGYAVVCGTSTLLLAVFYQACSKEGRFPWFLCVPMGPEAPLWSAWGTLTWLAFVGLLVFGWREFLGTRKAGTAKGTRDAAVTVV